MSKRKNLLLDLFDIAGLVITSPSRIPSRTYLEYQDIKRKDRQQLRQLERQKIISSYRKGNQMILKLTEKGKVKMLRELIIRRTRLLPAQTVCLVSFDIPEQARLARRSLRLLFRQAKFTKIHQSLWMSNHDVIEPLRQLIQELKTEEWIRIFRGQEC